MRKNYKMAGMICLGLLLSSKNSKAQTVSDFEGLTLSTDSFFNGSNLSGESGAENFTTEFISGDASFTNVWDIAFGKPGFWSKGFSLSSKTDSTTSGFGNQYSSRAGEGNNSLTYIVSKNNTKINFNGAANDTIVTSLFVTNGTYAAISMRDGDMFAKKFGDTLDANGVVDGTNGEDWFLLTIKGIATTGNLTTDSVNFYLADFRFANDTLDYIVTGWQSVDLTSLGNVSGLNFVLSSSDVGDFGINTPTLFCLDDILPSNSTLIDFEDLGITATDSIFNGDDFSGTPDDYSFTVTIVDGTAEFDNVWNNQFSFWSGGFAYSNQTDTVTSGFTNTYSARAGSGVNGSSNFMISKNNTSIDMTGTAINNTVSGLYITNNTYAANSMRDGDMFAKKFGDSLNADGLDDGSNGEDWFLLTIKGIDNNDAITTDSVNFYLADFRFSDDAQDYIVTDWQWVGLSSLGNVKSLTFALSSSDVGDFGMNTPAFFALDNLNDQSVGVNELSKNNVGFSICPNPTTNAINVVIDQPVNSLSVIDITGKILLSENKLDAGVHQLNLSFLKAGIYFIQIIADNTIQTKRIVKQ